MLKINPKKYNNFKDFRLALDSGEKLLPNVWKYVNSFNTIQ